MRLTDNFYLDEFLVSQTAERHGIDMAPPQFVIDNLHKLCVKALQPIRDKFRRPISISSGYRPEELNTMIGGSKTSAHRFGLAADFKIHGLEVFDTCHGISNMDILYDQNICEFEKWIHLGISEMNRRENLTAHRKNGRVAYVPGIHRMEDL